MKKAGIVFKNFFRPIIEMVLSSMKKNGEYDSKKINRFFILNVVLLWVIQYGRHHHWDFDKEVIFMLLAYAGYETNQITREKIALGNNNNFNNNNSQENEKSTK